MTDEQRQQAIAAIQQALPALEWTLQPAKTQTAFPRFSLVQSGAHRAAGGKTGGRRWFVRAMKELRAAGRRLRAAPAAADPARQRHRQLWPAGPLEGGMLVDMTGLNQIVALGSGTVRPRPAFARRTSKPPPPDGLGAALYAVDLSHWRARAASTAAGSAASAPSTMGRWRRQQ